MIRWKPFEYQGICYDLTHLHPKTIHYEQTSQENKPARYYTVEVIFGLHCFTRGLKDGEHSDETLLYRDARETRIFDFQRHQLSIRLPRIVDELQTRKCFHTGKGNFFTVEMISPQDARLIIEYDIFFEASRSTRRGIINLFVQSAYVRDSMHDSNRPKKKPIRFDVILYNTLNNKPIRLPK